MQCEAARTEIQAWMDAPGAPAMPEGVKTHVAACCDCQSFIQRWNAVELTLQAIRDQAPTPSAEFGRRLRERLSHEKPTRRAFLFLRPLGLALAGAAAVLMLFAIGMWAVTALRNSADPANYAGTTPAGHDMRTNRTAPGGAIPPSVPATVR